MKGFCSCLIAFLSISYSILNAQTPDWAWAKSAGIKYGREKSNDIVVDEEGNSYIIGVFLDTIRFDTSLLINPPFNTNQDVFIVKYSSTGNVIWAKSVSSISIDEGMSIAVDNAGNVYVTGAIQGDCHIGNFSVTWHGEFDLFVLKLDSNGNALWLKSAGGFASEIAYSIAVDNQGNAYVAGGYRSDTINFGSFMLTNIYTTSWLSNIFIVKYSPSGNVLWAKSANGGAEDFARSIAVDSEGNSYISGKAESSTITFGDSAYHNFSPTFLAKYNTNGDCIWVKELGGIYQKGINLTVDLNGYLYGCCNVDNFPFTINDSIISNTDSNTAFILKFNPLGDIAWSKSLTGFISHVKIDEKSNLYITGTYNRNSYFGTTALLCQDTIQTIFVAKLDSLANPIWAKSGGKIGGAYSDVYPSTCSCGIGIDDFGDVYITGAYKRDSLKFGNVTLLNSSINYQYPTPDLYIARLSMSAGITEQNNKSVPFTISPNPFSSLLSISLPNRPIHFLNISVNNVLGQTVFTTTEDSPNSAVPKTLNLSNIPQGMYFLQLNVDGVYYSQKILKVG